MSRLSDLIDALETEFSGDPKVLFSPSVPARFSPPQIVVTPGDPFLEPGQLGDQIRERWSVLVVVSMADRAAGVQAMRQNSLRIRRAVSPLGAIWEQASGPQVPEGESAAQVVLSENMIRFKYPATEQTPATP